jgi:hypothetical protein
MHHNPPEVHALSLRQPPLDGAVAPADSNSETEPDSGAEDLTTIGKPTMPASDSATEPYCGTKELVNIIKKPDLKLSSVLVSHYNLNLFSHLTSLSSSQQIQSVEEILL